MKQLWDGAIIAVLLFTLPAFSISGTVQSSKGTAILKNVNSE